MQPAPRHSNQLARTPAQKIVSPSAINIGGPRKSKRTHAQVTDMDDLQPPKKQAKIVKSQIENPSNNDFTSPMITILCGDKELYVHKAVLVAQSPYFAACLDAKSDLLESGMNKIALKDTDENSCASMLQWMYYGDLPTLPMTEWEKITGFMNLYALAGRMMMPQLQNHAIDCLNDCYKERDSFSGAAMCRLTHELDLLQSPLGLYVMKTFVFRMMIHAAAHGSGPAIDSSGSLGQFHDRVQTLCADSELIACIMHHVLNYQQEPWFDPCKSFSCEFHLHVDEAEREQCEDMRAQH